MRVLRFNMGDPTTKAREKLFDAPRRTREGAITEAQQEQKGWGSAKRAPKRLPPNPVRAKKDFR
jgi:hypothetical protein